MRVYLVTEARRTADGALARFVMCVTSSQHEAQSICAELPVAPEFWRYWQSFTVDGSRAGSDDGLLHFYQRTGDVATTVARRDEHEAVTLVLAEVAMCRRIARALAGTVGAVAMPGDAP